MAAELHAWKAEWGRQGYRCARQWPKATFQIIIEDAGRSALKRSASNKYARAIGGISNGVREWRGLWQGARGRHGGHAGVTFSIPSLEKYFY